MEAVFDAMTAVFGMIMDQLGMTITTITSNNLLFIPIIISFGGGLILAGVKIARKLGVRSGGGRRRRKRG